MLRIGENNSSFETKRNGCSDRVGKGDRHSRGVEPELWPRIRHDEHSMLPSNEPVL